MGNANGFGSKRDEYLHLPIAQHLCDFWALRGPDSRKVTCSVYRVATGLELRTRYGETQILETQLFPRGPDVIERVVETADEWRANMLSRRFTETDR